MSIINIAIECNSEHKEAIYTLATSVAKNKNKKSIYNICFLLNNTEEKNWEELRKLENENIKISFEKVYGELAKKTDRVIYLKWNTLVMGDLTQLYEIDMEDKCQAKSANFPEIEYSISNGEKYFDDSVCLIDNKKEYKEEKCKELPIYYNLAYDELAKDKTNKFKKTIQIKSDELTNLKDWALIIRYNKKHSPDKYFDSVLSGMWMKYYKLSPLKNVNICREAYIETIGKIGITETTCGGIDNSDKANVMPILIAVNDKTVANVVAMIHSIEKSVSEKKKLEIRLVYTQLSSNHKDILLKACSERVNVVLYNIKAWKYADINMSSIVLVSQIFTEYHKALFINGSVLCNEKIEELYDTDPEDCLIVLDREYENIQVTHRMNILTNKVKSDSNACTSKDVDTNDSSNVAVLVNIDAWIDNGVCDIIADMMSDMAYELYNAFELAVISCAKKLMWLEIGNVWAITENNKEEYINAVKDSLSKILCEEDVEKEMKYIINGDDDKVREIIERIQKLEEDNAKMLEKNKLLATENAILSKERNQFLYEIVEIRKSFTYKVGRMITFIPRLLRGKR